MIALNLTLLVQLGLFLTFLWVTNRFFLRPLLKVMDGRVEKIQVDTAQAEADSREAKRLEADRAANLDRARQAAVQHLREARYHAIGQQRIELEALRHQAEQEVQQSRAILDATMEAERRKFPEALPKIVEAIERQVTRPGGLL